MLFTDKRKSLKKALYMAIIRYLWLEVKKKLTKKRINLKTGIDINKKAHYNRYHKDINK